jgi:hypothetical protein
MKIIKATIDQIREWKLNSSHLVDDAGEIVGLLDPSLEQSVATVVRTARQKLKSIVQVVKVGKLEARVEVIITRTGRSNDEYTIETAVDGMRIVSGREIVAARLLFEHGECQLRHPNGVILKVIRDPSIRRTTFAESLQIAPKPENCSCASWGKPHPGVHYATCPWNRLAPPDEQAAEAPTEAELAHLPKQAYASLARSPGAPVVSSRPDPKRVLAESNEPDAPETCRNGCLNFATPKGLPIPAGQHHPTCFFALPWAQKTAKEVPRFLVDLRTGEKVRAATDQEIGQADIAAKRTGSPIVHVDDVPYAVLLATELGTESELRREPESEKKVSAPGVVENIVAGDILDLSGAGGGT